MSLRLQLHFRKFDLIIELAQLYKNDLERAPTQQDFEASLEHAMRYRDGWLAYRNAFGQASYINLHTVERMNLIGD